jgi:uncharacterized protein YcbK (DUF882 family)
LAVFAISLIGDARGTQDAVANGDTRSLTLYHTHTRENATVTFRRNGQYDPRGLEQLNWMLRDWRRDEPTEMDPRLFDTIWEVYRQSGSSEPIHIASAYRSPQTNAMLRRRSSAVAKNSQHMLGKAMDFYLPDVPIERLRAIGMKLQHGGVGYYPSAYSPFVHVDVGSVRAWPRMTRDQLVRLFPDGKTVHIPADGTPLPGYEEARAEVLAEGWSVAGYNAVADAGAAATPQHRSFWARLFGLGGDDDEDAEEIRSARTRQVYVARRTPPPNIYDGDRGSSVYAALRPPDSNAPAGRAVQPQSESVELATAAREEQKAPPPTPFPAPTRIAGLPSTVETPSGPKLAWQQGSNGQTLTLRPSSPDAQREMALAPLPPPRPDEIVATGALAFAPMPPARPGTLGAQRLMPILVASAEPANALSGAAQPEPAHPLPPMRPHARPVAVASLDPRSATPVPSAPAVAGKGEDRFQLRALFSDAAGTPEATSTKPKPRPAPAENVAVAAAPLNLGFSAKPMGDLSASRFTGPAVKPLPVLR